MCTAHLSLCLENVKRLTLNVLLTDIYGPDWGLSVGGSGRHAIIPRITIYCTTNSHPKYMSFLEVSWKSSFVQLISCDITIL